MSSCPTCTYSMMTNYGMPMPMMMKSRQFLAPTMLPSLIPHQHSSRCLTHCHHSPMMMSHLGSDDCYHNEFSFMPSRPASHAEFLSLLKPVAVDLMGNRWVNFCADMRGFRPDEIRVDFDAPSKTISIFGCQETNDDTKVHHLVRHYERRLRLPDEMVGMADLSKVEFRSYLTKKGTLWIEAMLPKISFEETKHDFFPQMMAAIPNRFSFIKVKTVGGGSLAGEGVVKDVPTKADVMGKPPTATTKHQEEATSSARSDAMADGSAEMAEKHSQVKSPSKRVERSVSESVSSKNKLESVKATAKTTDNTGAGAAGKKAPTMRDAADVGSGAAGH